MNFLTIMIIRSRTGSRITADYGLNKPGIQFLCISLEKDRAGTILNHVVPLPEQRPITGKTWPAFFEMLKTCRPSSVFFDLQDCVSSMLIKVFEKQLSSEFSNIRLVSAAACRREEEKDFWQELEAISAYSQLKPIPGIPLIQVIGDSGLYSLVINAMNQMGYKGKSAKNRLMRIRVDEAVTRLCELGENLEYHFEKPGDIPPEVMNEIVDMVGAGGSVDTTHVRANLKTAYLIGYTMENGVIVGDSSLKHPRPEFISRLKNMTGLDLSGCVERGYTSVRPEYRSLGIGTLLLAGLTERALDVGIYSVIDEKNIAAQKIAINNNTRKIAQYFSEKANKHLGVWMPEEMAQIFLSNSQNSEGT